MADDDPQFTAIPVFVPAGPASKFKRPLIEQLEQPVRRLRAEPCFPLTARRMGFGSVDVSDPDLDTIHMKRVAVDDTIPAKPTATADFEEHGARSSAPDKKAAENAHAEHHEREDNGGRTTWKPTPASRKHFHRMPYLPTEH
jgi:hypothetical protein